MPIERRNSKTQRTTLVVMVAGTAVVALLVYLLVRAASGPGGMTLRLGTDTFDAGLASERAESIKAGGPLLFSDVSGNGQTRPIYLGHTGSDPLTGWVVVSASPPGAPAGCYVEWNRSASEFRPKGGCWPGTFPADGTGLTGYPWKITADKTIEIDLRPSTGNAGTTTTR